ncbi:hypothetical protein PVK06_047527 [Gossypium arboreum]|uniref:Uncharacterized protein n=1 Tax=Gossypium arboreum TaxID=29729 RepID=A0ABR0MDK0_GOSAR|nr:hypothetical protein PVK06_047527 [Gossypium arboreum]
MRPRPSTQNRINRRKLAHSGSHPPSKPDPGLDWSILLKPTSPSSSGWPEPKSKLDSTVRPASIEDQAKFSNMQMQNKVIDSCKDFFKNRVYDEENDYGDDDTFDEDEEEKNENTLQGEGSNKNVENLETENSSGKVHKDASDSLDKGDDLNVTSGGVEFVNADGNGSVKKRLLVMITNSLEKEDANENVESLEISDGGPKSMVQNVKHEEMKEKDEFQTGIDVTATIGFLTSFEHL